MRIALCFLLLVAAIASMWAVRRFHLFGYHSPPRANVVLTPKIDENIGTTGIFIKDGFSHPQVERVAAGSGAAKAHLSSGDQILAIGGADTQFLCRRQIIWKLKGLPGTTAFLKIQRLHGTVVDVAVQRVRPGDLPDPADRSMLNCTERPEDAERSFTATTEEPSLEWEKPWILANINGSIVELYDSSTGPAAVPAVMTQLGSPIGATPTGPRVEPEIIPLPVIYTRLPMEDPAVKAFAARFGISTAPAYIFNGPGISGTLPQAFVVKDPTHNSETVVLPNRLGGCIGVYPATATPGKFISRVAGAKEPTP